MQNRVKNIGRALIRSTTSLRFLRNQLQKATRGGIVPRTIWGKLPVATTFQVHLPHEIQFLYCSTAYDGIGRQLFWAGEKHWEYETISVFCKLAKRSKNARKVVIDLIDEMGMKGWHAGSINNSVVSESLTSVLIFINKFYKIKGSGISIIDT